MNSVLIKPLITEKSMQEAAKNRYTFAVNVDANKAQIYEEVKKTFNVKPIGIKTITIHGKTKLARKTHSTSVEPNWKKAIIELPAGQKLAIFDTTDAKKA